MEIAPSTTGGPSNAESIAGSSATVGPTNGFHWSAGLVAQAVALFLVAGLAEIGGGWLVWQTVREHKAWWMAVVGCVVLIAYGFIPTAQPTDNFGRVFAVYGGFFIVLSYLWGWAVDGVRPDIGDWVGTSVAIVGVCIAMFWRR